MTCILTVGHCQLPNITLYANNKVAACFDDYLLSGGHKSFHAALKSPAIHKHVFLLVTSVGYLSFTVQSVTLEAGFQIQLLILENFSAH